VEGPGGRVDHHRGVDGVAARGDGALVGRQWGVVLGDGCADLLGGGEGEEEQCYGGC